MDQDILKKLFTEHEFGTDEEYRSDFILDFMKQKNVEDSDEQLNIKLDNLFSKFNMLEDNSHIEKNYCFLKGVLFDDVLASGPKIFMYEEIIKYLNLSTTEQLITDFEKLEKVRTLFLSLVNNKKENIKLYVEKLKLTTPKDSLLNIMQLIYNIIESSEFDVSVEYRDYFMNEMDLFLLKMISILDIFNDQDFVEYFYKKLNEHFIHHKIEKKLNEFGAGKLLRKLNLEDDGNIGKYLYNVFQNLWSNIHPEIFQQQLQSKKRLILYLKSIGGLVRDTIKLDFKTLDNMISDYISSYISERRSLYKYVINKFFTRLNDSATNPKSMDWLSFQQIIINKADEEEVVQMKISDLIFYKFYEFLEKKDVIDNDSVLKEIQKLLDKTVDWENDIIKNKETFIKYKKMLNQSIIPKFKLVNIKEGMDNPTELIYIFQPTLPENFLNPHPTLLYLHLKNEKDNKLAIKNSIVKV